MSDGPEVVVRQATRDDHEAVTAFTEDTWPDRDVDDYLPTVFPEWVEREASASDGDGPGQRTVVATVDGDVVGVCQGTRLSAHEAWAQGMRVDPAHRGTGVGRALNEAVFDWAADGGATVCRNLVFSWNAAGLGLSRGLGYDPVTTFRWVHPDPSPDPAATTETTHEVRDRPDAAWTHWTRSDARTALGGLALSPTETWALQELTPAMLRRASDETRLLSVHDDGACGLAYRVRDYVREADGCRWAEYGLADWADPSAARALFAAIRRDAAAVDADRTRVLVPATPRHVSDAAYVGIGVGDDPDYVMEADLTGWN